VLYIYYTLEYVTFHLQEKSPSQSQSQLLSSLARPVLKAFRNIEMPPVLRLWLVWCRLQTKCRQLPKIKHILIRDVLTLLDPASLLAIKFYQLHAYVLYSIGEFQTAIQQAVSLLGHFQHFFGL
jgi:hypothetical protein